MVAKILSPERKEMRVNMSRDLIDTADKDDRFEENCDRSELIAIRRGLQCAAQLEDRFQEIWILTDSRASIQHLANWGDIGDQTSLDILSLLHDLSSGHSIHFQWIPSHVGIEGNERADFLARTAAAEGVSPRGKESHIF
ncbi:RNase H domain-containing protein [Trichonephila clavipes]|nr:RNase H domain-containing protein [Trichonephila clavipes]